MENLHFGARARQKARLKRTVPLLWAISMFSMAAGLPGSNVTVDLLERVTGLKTHGRGIRGVETSESAANLMRFRAKTFASRPDPTPTPVPVTPSPEPVAAPAAPAGTISSIIYAAAAEFGLDGGYLLAVAQCESGLNPGAYNASGYHGLFQFDTGTWAANGYGSIYDPVAQARTAARLIAAGQASRWPSCA